MYFCHVKEVLCICIAMYYSAVHINTTYSLVVLSSLMDAIQAKPAALPVRHSLRSVVTLPAPVLLVSMTTMALASTPTTVIPSPVKIAPHVQIWLTATFALVWPVTQDTTVQMKLMNVTQTLVRMVEIALTFSTTSTALVHMATLVKRVES